MSFISLRQDKLKLAGAHNAISVQVKEFVIRIGNDVLAKLGWAERDKIDVSAGTDEDSGKIRLLKCPNGWSLLPPGGRKKTASGRIIKIKRTHANEKLMQNPPARLAATGVTLTVHDGIAEFRLPWAPQDETTEEAIRRGVKVTKCPPAMPATFGSPVRSKTNAWTQRNGRV